MVLGVDISVSVLNALVLSVDISVLVFDIINSGVYVYLGRRHSGPEEAIGRGEEYRGS